MSYHFKGENMVQLLKYNSEKNTFKVLYNFEMVFRI